MKGDYAEIIYRTGAGVGIAVKKIVAEKDGSSVEITMPSRTETFITVTVLSKVKDPTSTNRFLASEVLSITEGHEQIARKRKGKQA